MVKIHRQRPSDNPCGPNSARRKQFLVAALVVICLLSQIYFAFFGLMYRSNELPSEKNALAESLVSYALASQMNLWPPSSVCNRNFKFFQGNTQQEQGQRAFLSLYHVRKEIRKLRKEALAQNKTLGLEELGQRLLNRAKFLNQTLLTVHVGAVFDGDEDLSNDPLHQAIANPKNAAINNDNLRHWMPVAVEGSADKFAKLSRDYQDIIGSSEIPCSLVAHWAVSYKTTRELRGGMCEFCRFRDITQDSPSLCRVQPDRIKAQMGPEACRQSEMITRDVVKQCFARDQVECGSMLDFFQRKMDGLVQAASRISILQISGGEYAHMILPNLIQEFAEQTQPYDLPPVIHYGRDLALREIGQLLERQGYVVYDGKRYDLAILSSSHKPKLRLPT